MIVVGVTGKYCTGKSTVGDILGEHGYPQIEVDRLGHDALEQEADRVIAAFGVTIVDANGRVDRKALGRIVFGNDEALGRLEAIVHPRMVEMTASRVDELRSAHPGAPGIVINAAILFRMRLHPLCNTVVLVAAPFLSIWRRARERDGASLFDVIRRLRSQRDVDPQYSHPDADIHSVENHGDRGSLCAQLARFLPLP